MAGAGKPRAWRYFSGLQSRTPQGNRPALRCFMWVSAKTRLPSRTERRCHAVAMSTRSGTSRCAGSVNSNVASNDFDAPAIKIVIESWNSMLQTVADLFFGKRIGDDPHA